MMNIKQGLRLHSPPWCLLKFLYDMLSLLDVQNLTTIPMKKLRNFVQPYFWSGPSTNYLKGHGNETDFLGFLHKLLPHESLTLPIEPFRFWLRMRGNILN
jgi:hypothetical protein